MTFIDIGANIGYYTLLASQCIGDTGLVLALEPEPLNYAVLCANIWDASIRNAAPLRAAATAETSTVRLAISEDNIGGHALSASQGIEVPGVRVDDLVASGRRVDLVKIDIQGWDHRAVIGLESTIARDNPTMVVEYWPEGIAAMGDKPVDVLSYYDDLGYFVSVVETPDQQIPPPRFPDLVRSASETEDGFVTLVLSPRSSHGGARKAAWRHRGYLRRLNRR
jgi:FkbM family methyltransferase